MLKPAPGSRCSDSLFGGAVRTRRWITFAGCVIAAAALMVSPGVAVAQCMPQTDRAEETWLHGTIGEGNEVRMYLLRHGGDWTGTYYYVRWWGPIWLRGSWNDKAIIRLTESVHSKETGTLDLYIGAGDQVTGTWTSPDGQRSAPVALKKTAQVPCDGEGPWTTFTDPSWPVSFDYPADWKVQIEDESLMVVCPDPASMAMGTFGTVWLTRGRGEDSLDTEGPFERVEGRWVYDQLGRWGWCHESVDSCVEATITVGKEMTILAGPTQAVCHCLGDGGRIGSCGIQAFAFLVSGDRWVRMLSYPGAYSFTSRMADSVRPAGDAP